MPSLCTVLGVQGPCSGLGLESEETALVPGLVSARVSTVLDHGLTWPSPCESSLTTGTLAVS